MNKIIIMILAFIITPLITVKPLDTVGFEKEKLKVDERAVKIDKYFSTRGMPLYGYGEKFVERGDFYRVEPFLLAAISVQESSGGLHACGYNVFGWASCLGEAGQFNSYDEAIDVVAKNISGNNEDTRTYYEGKDIRGILSTYNPP